MEAVEQARFRRSQCQSLEVPSEVEVEANRFDGDVAGFVPQRRVIRLRRQGRDQAEEEQEAEDR